MYLRQRASCGGGRRILSVIAVFGQRCCGHLIQHPHQGRGRRSYNRAGLGLGANADFQATAEKKRGQVFKRGGLCPRHQPPIRSRSGATMLREPAGRCFLYLRRRRPFEVAISTISARRQFFHHIPCSCLVGAMIPIPAQDHSEEQIIFPSPVF